jgi:hypothetical protein
MAATHRSGTPGLISSGTHSFHAGFHFKIMKKILLLLLLLTTSVHAQRNYPLLGAKGIVLIPSSLTDFADTCRISLTANSANGLFINLPPSMGSSGNVIQTDGAGNWTWVAPSGGGMSNPMTTLGDIIYENATPAPARLAGNTTTTKEFLTQTGTSSISAAPSWATIASGDIPSGSGSYIQNQNSGAQSSSNFWISGNGTFAGNIFEPAITNASVALWSNTGELSNSVLGVGQIMIGEGSGNPIALTTLTQGQGAIITSASGAITIADSARTFAQYKFVSSTSFAVTSSNLSAITNIVVENTGTTTVTIPPAIQGVELLIYRSAGSYTTTVALGSGASFIGGQTTITIPATTGAGVRLVGVVSGYWLIQNIP